jgi:hypothetical protein
MNSTPTELRQRSEMKGKTKGNSKFRTYLTAGTSYLDGQECKEPRVVRTVAKEAKGVTRKPDIDQV